MESQSKLDPTLASLLRHMRDDIEWTLDGVVSPRQGLDRIQMGLRAACEVLDQKRSETPINPEKDRKQKLMQAQQWASSTQVVEWCLKNKVLLDRTSYWWFLPERRHGHIHGLGQKDGARLEGHAVVTNGVDVWIELDSGGVAKGHLDWFRKDPKPRQNAKPRKTKVPKDESEKQKIKEELMQMLNEV